MRYNKVFRDRPHSRTVDCSKCPTLLFISYCVYFINQTLSQVLLRANMVYIEFETLHWGSWNVSTVGKRDSCNSGPSLCCSEVPGFQWVAAVYTAHQAPWLAGRARPAQGPCLLFQAHFLPSPAEPLPPWPLARPRALC